MEQKCDNYSDTYRKSVNSVRDKCSVGEQELDKMKTRLEGNVQGIDRRSPGYDDWLRRRSRAFSNGV